jgi:hypothetical protein
MRIFFVLMLIIGIFDDHAAAQTRFSFGTTNLLDFALVPPVYQEEDGFKRLFNGKNLDGWQRVNTAQSTWSVKDGMLICTGKPTGELRTERMYQNFILEVEWRHMKPKGNAGIFVWADDITSKGVPFHRSIEIQVLENAYGNTRGYTTHGDIFPIHGAKMTPVNGRGGSRAFPTENRSNPSPQWNHYRIECREGNVSLSVNGKLVTQGKKCSPSKGYICIESEGGVAHYRNMKIKVLEDTPVEKSDIAIADRGFNTLYNGIDLSGFKTTGMWRSNDWRLNCVSGDGGELSTKQKFGATRFIVDFRTSEKLPRFQFAGCEFELDSVKATLAKGNGWNRLEFQFGEKKQTLAINGEPVVEKSEILDPNGELKIICDGPTEFANLYVGQINAK